jgi:hypothetical protein
MGKKKNDGEEEGVQDNLFDIMRAEYGLLSMLYELTANKPKSDQYYTVDDIISRVVGSLLATNLDGKGRETALACLKRELATMRLIQQRRRRMFLYNDVDLTQREMRGLNRYIEALEHEVAKLILAPQPIELPEE